MKCVINCEKVDLELKAFLYCDAGNLQTRTFHHESVKIWALALNKMLLCQLLVSCGKGVKVRSAGYQLLR